MKTGDDKFKKLYRPYPESLLDESYHKPMVIVLAPSGYGKTTLVRDWLARHTDMQHVWVMLGQDETDEDWMWQKVCGQFEGINEEISHKLKECGLPRTNQEIDNLIQLIQHDIKGPLCLVVDDFHECSSEAINRLITRLVYADIAYLHMILIGRLHPQFSYEEMILKGYCVVIDQQALTLTKEETNEIFESNGVHLSEEEVNKLVGYTDGWIAAVYLTLLDYKRQRQLRLSMSMLHLLKTAIYDKAPEPIRQILMKMSLFEGFTIDEARYVTEIDVDETGLQSMMEVFGFGHYVMQDGKYVIHSLLKSVARAELDRSKLNKNELLFRDGQWQEDNGNPIQAINCYIKCGVMAKVLAVLSGEDGMDVCYQMSVVLDDFFAKLPMEDRLDNPKAYLSYIYAMAIQRDVRKAERLLEAVEKGYRERAEEGFDVAATLGEISIIKAMLQFNDIKAMAKTMADAFERLRGQSSSIFKNNVLTYGTPCTLHLYHRDMGSLREIVEAEKEYTRYYMKLIQRMDCGWDELYDAEYAYTTAQFSKALELARMVGEKAKFMQQLCIVISSYFIQLNCLIHLGMLQEFEKTIEELEREMKGVVRPVFTVDYELTVSNVYAKVNWLDRVPEWVQNFNLDECGRIIRSVRSGCMTFGIMLIQTEQWARLDAIAERMMMPYENSVHLYVTMSAYIYKAIAMSHLQTKEKALAWIRKALEIAKCDGIKAPLIENGRELKPLLMELAREDGYAKEILPYCDVYLKNTKKFGEKKTKTMLTERELEIMKLVENGLRNTEISEKMHIALVTVEKTLTNIYRKLGVSNRAAAVAKWGGGGTVDGIMTLPSDEEPAEYGLPSQEQTGEQLKK